MRGNGSNSLYWTVTGVTEGLGDAAAEDAGTKKKKKGKRKK